MNNSDRLKEIEKEHEERLQKYSLEERKKAFDRLNGCFSELKDIDIREEKRKALING